jgi:hypothetical protein
MRLRAAALVLLGLVVEAIGDPGSDTHDVERRADPGECTRPLEFRAAADIDSRSCDVERPEEPGPSRSTTAPEIEFVWPQISYSIAVGRSEERVMAHLWVGAGAHVMRSVFVLGGLEFDFRSSGKDQVQTHDSTQSTSSGGAAIAVQDVAPPQRLTINSPASHATSSGGNEAWLAARVGIGGFNPRALGPLVAAYVIFASRIAGPDDAPTRRFGLGFSAPVALPLCQVGIPSMIELGLDGGGHSPELRGFVRAGWNF